jgi:transcriptional regulator with XRE-family HTH domain
MTNEEIKQAKEIWKRRFGYEDLASLKQVRLASQRSTRQIAKASGISNYARFEESEANGSISLKNMRRAAEALDCDFEIICRSWLPSLRSFRRFARGREPIGLAGPLKSLEDFVAVLDGFGE